ncbi:MAG TPA: hypothetical protein VGX48_14660 [Pyrinomonadaceae bacterium]|nr:hypothetical protein [Pyrinomonadaceae bacterium]
MDFHARQQTVCFSDSAGGEVRLAELRHDRDDVSGFYSQFTGGVLVGVTDPQPAAQGGFTQGHRPPFKGRELLRSIARVAGAFHLLMMLTG